MMSNHRTRYKNAGLNPEELRRRRENDNIQLRKQKRDQFISKRRTTQPESDFDNGLIEEKQDDLLDYEVDDIQLTDKVFEDLKQDADSVLLLRSARIIRKCLSKEPDPPFTEVLENGIMPRLVQLLDYAWIPQLQFEVAWILTNISSSISEHTWIVAESGAVPKLVRLAIDDEDIKLKEQAIWALGNIIGDGTELRDRVISCGLIPPLIRSINPHHDVCFLRNLGWVVVNLCRYQDPPISLDIVNALKPGIKTLLSVSDDKILIDATWAISYIIELGPEYIQTILDEDLIKQMLPLLENKETRLLTATVRAFGSMTAGSDDQTQVLINAGVLHPLSSLLNTKNPKVAKDILWLVSNIAAGTNEQVQELIEAGFIEPVIYYLKSGDFSQQKEATWTVYNLTITGSTEQLYHLVEHQAVCALCDLLTLSDITILKKSLEALKNLLAKCGEVHPPVAIQIEQCGGLDRIEALQNSDTEEIYLISCEMIEQYFS